MLLLVNACVMGGFLLQTSTCVCLIACNVHCSGIELPEVFIDAFNGGAQLNRDDCLALVPFVEPSEGFFRTSRHYEVQ